MEEKNGKPVGASRTETVRVVLPNDTNNLGNLLGGTLLHWIDMAAAVAATRHCGRPVVTASMDRVDFIAPVPRGAFCILKASVNRSWRTSMEVGVKVYAEEPLSGGRRHTASAYLTFVALGEDGRPVPVPEVRPETEEERRRWREAGARRQERLRSRKPMD